MSKKNKIQLLIVVAILTLGVIIISMLLQNGKSQYTYIDTELKSTQNFSYIKNQNLYHYNGVAFMQTNLQNSETTLLFSSPQLPNPNAIHWLDDQGVIISFDGSFVGSSIEKLLLDKDLTINSITETYVWFINFKTGRISLVNEAIGGVGQIAFDKKLNNAYFVPRNFPQDQTMSLYRLSIETGSTSVVNSLQIQDISYLGECKDDYICLTGRDITSSRNKGIYVINKSTGDITLSFSTRGEINPTSHPHLFMITSDESEDGGDEHDHDIEPFYGKGTIYDLVENTQTQVDYDHSDDILITQIGGEKNEFFSISNYPTVDEENSKIHYRAGKLTSKKTQTREYVLESPDGEALLNTLLIKNDGYGAGGTTLVTGLHGEQLLLFNQKSFTPNMPTVSDRGDVWKTLDTCELGEKKGTRQYYDEEKLTRLFFTDNDSLATNIRKLSACIRSNPNVFFGHNLKVSTLDPVNGRITSN